MLLNSSFFDAKFFDNSWGQDFLGFGQKANYLPFPQSGLHTLPLSKLAPIISGVLKALPKKIVSVLLPQKIKSEVRNFNKDKF